MKIVEKFVNFNTISRNEIFGSLEYQKYKNFRKIYPKLESGYGDL